MPPKRKLHVSCSCRKHSEYCGGNEQSSYPVRRTDGYKIKKEVIGALISNGALSDRAMYLCEGCAQYAEKNMMTNKKRKLTGTKHVIAFTYKF